VPPLVATSAADLLCPPGSVDEHHPAAAISATTGNGGGGGRNGRCEEKGHGGGDKEDGEGRAGGRHWIVHRIGGQSIIGKAGHGLPCAYHTIIYVRDEREPGDNKQHGITGALTIISLIILGLIQKLIKLKIPIMD